ncbi:MAG: S8 family serine peptidase [Gemmatimonadota bacterium]
MRGLLAWLVPITTACAGGAPSVVPVPMEPIPSHATVVTPDRREAARAAYRAGLMPLHATGVDAFAQLHPERDGRGVLIGILDSGIDPSVPGLQRTSDGQQKVLALRDFSGEGAIALLPANMDGDRVGLGHFMVAGRSRLAALASGQLYAGLVPEARFGQGAGADLSGNGVVGDTLLVIVARGPSAWFAMIDSDLDGTLANDDALEDFDRTGRWSGWSADTAQAPRVVLSATLSERDGLPVLTLVFDADGHGTHVAGIAAGFGLYDVEGFDGVAPGARLLGLKIASNGLGGVTTTGSLVEAIQFALAAAAERRMPLVLNLSFGVGNQREGTALLDALVDSVLRAHPGLVMTVSAGNDGPGLSTLGFPASATRVLSVGATSPLVFAGLGPGSSIPDPVAHFSSRGGERAGPDLVAPGTAWSTVPRYNAGHEELGGTSMAAPHLAGLIARLISLQLAEGRPANRDHLQQALMATATPVPFATILDQGAGVPNILAAMRYLEATSEVPALESFAANDSTHSGVWFDGVVLPERFGVLLRRRDDGGAMRIRLRSTVPWLEIEGDPVRPLPIAGTTVSLHVEPGSHLTAGVRIGALLVEDADDEGLGVLLRVPVTIRRPMPLAGDVHTLLAMQAGEIGREVVDADSGRALEVAVETLSRTGLVLVGLHEGGGQPARDRVLTTAGYREERAVIRIPGDDVQRARYEIALVASPTVGVAARVSVRQGPVRLDATLGNGALVLGATNMTSAPIQVALAAEWIGAESRFTLGADTARPAQFALPIPSWAATLRLDIDVPAADWSRFTDFGVTLRDRNGRLLAEAPMTYAFGRMHFTPPPHLRGDTVYVVLAPAAVTKGPATPWEAHVKVRYLDAAPVAAGIGGVDRFPLAPGERRTVHGSAVAASRTTDPDLVPLLRIIARDAEGTPWITELTPTPGKDAPE